MWTGVVPEETHDSTSSWSMLKAPELFRSSMWALAMKELDFAEQGRNLLNELAILMQRTKDSKTDVQTK